MKSVQRGSHRDHSRRRPSMTSGSPPQTPGRTARQEAVRLCFHAENAAGQMQDADLGSRHTERFSITEAVQGGKGHLVQRGHSRLERFRRPAAPPWDPSGLSPGNRNLPCMAALCSFKSCWARDSRVPRALSPGTRGTGREGGCACPLSPPPPRPGCDTWHWPVV